MIGQAEEREIHNHATIQHEKQEEIMSSQGILAFRQVGTSSLTEIANELEQHVSKEDLAKLV